MVCSYLEDLLNASPITIISTSLVIFLGIVYFSLKDRGLPPGPRGLPLVGYWPFLRHEDTHQHLLELKKKYGDVFSINIAGNLIIHLGSTKALKEAHVTKADCFTERHSMGSLIDILFGDGIITANGERWKALRKFFIQAFREYGLTSVKGHMSGPIYDSINASVDTIKATNGSPMNIISILNDRAADIFRRMMFNDSEITDEELKGILECYQKVVVIVQSKQLLLMGKFAKYFMLPKIKGFKCAVESHEKIKEYLRNMVRRHEKSFSEDNIRDVIDSYIKERNERRRKGDPSAEFFSENAVVASLIQIVGDGILGIAIFLAYFFHALLEYPDEQEKIYKELLEIVGPDRPVTTEDRSKLPYTNAFIQEVLRTTDFFLIVPGLLCTKETTLNGYRIPKGAITMYNLWACHRDPKVYEDPDEFKPSRYISQPGKPKVEPPVPFGVGRRSCAGESFTMSQVFLFVTTIVKNFHLERPKGEVKKNFIDGVMEICAYPRK